MNPQQLRNMFQQTLDDYRLSRGERQALSRILEHVDPTDAILGSYRKVAFELAQDAIAEGGMPKIADVLGWLEDVARVLAANSGSSSREHRAESYFSPDDDCVKQIRGFLGIARATVDICVFTITDDRISDTVLDLHQRGRKVRIITDNDKAYDPGSDVERLGRQGVPVRVDSSPYHMHHKFAIVDGSKLLTGSYNWTRTAARENEENFLITDNPRLVGRYGKTFEGLWAKFA